jgi:hypothetical protein
MPSPRVGCVVIEEMVKNVMLVSASHRINPELISGSETLNQPMKQVQGMVQGDKKGVTT